jgi:hypothetical protein
MDIHDFRFVKGKTHTNLLFDISAPFEMTMNNAEILEAVQNNISGVNSSYFIVANVDRC